MKKDTKCECGCEGECKCGCKSGWSHYHKKMGKGPGIYCLGFIGALVYYIGTATGFWLGVLGILKAIVWPAFVVYALMGYLGM